MSEITSSTTFSSKPIGNSILEGVRSTGRPRLFDHDESGPAAGQLGVMRCHSSHRLHTKAASSITSVAAIRLIALTR